MFFEFLWSDLDPTKKVRIRADPNPQPWVGVCQKARLRITVLQFIHLLLNELRSDDPEGGGAGLVGHGLGQQGLTRTRGTVQDHTLPDTGRSEDLNIPRFLL